MARTAKLKIRKLKDGRFIIEEPTELHNGKRHQSTFTSRSKAELRLAELRTMRANFGGSLSVMSSTRIADANEAYKRLSEAGIQISLLAAVDAYIAEHKKRSQSVSLEALFDQYIASKETAHPKYRSELRTALDKFPYLKQVMVSDISTNDIESSLEGVSNGARNSALKCAKSVFAFGIDRGYCQENPVKKSSFAKRAKLDREIIPVGKVQAILDYALENSPEIVPYLSILFFAGVRPSDEALSLKWSDIENDILVVKEVKAGDRREIPLSSNAVAWINVAKSRYTSTSDLILAVTKADIEKRRKAAYAAAGYKHIPQDGARHSFASYWLPVNGNDFGGLLSRMGHADLKMLKAHYLRHASIVDARAYWQIVPE